MVDHVVVRSSMSSIVLYWDSRVFFACLVGVRLLEGLCFLSCLWSLVCEIVLWGLRSSGRYGASISMERRCAMRRLGVYPLFWVIVDR